MLVVVDSIMQSGVAPLIAMGVDPFSGGLFQAVTVAEGELFRQVAFPSISLFVGQ
jgi:hypothetical protein